MPLWRTTDLSPTQPPSPGEQYANVFSLASGPPGPGYNELGRAESKLPLPSVYSN